MSALAARAPMGKMLCRRVLAHLGLAIAVALLQGCASAPPLEAPLAPIPVPGQFSATGEIPLPEQWWRSFKDPALNQLQRQALIQNFTLAEARARLRQAQALAVQAGAAQMPTLDATGQARAERGNRNGSSDRNVSAGTSERYGLGLATGYEVDLWGRLEAGARAAEAEQRAVAADLQTAAISISAEVASTYFELLQQLAGIELLEAQETTNSQIAELIRLRFLNGQSDLDELLRQQQLVSQTGSQLLQARAGAELLTQQLAVLTGRPPLSPVTVNPEPQAFLPPLPDTGIPSQWLRRRPDVVAAFARLEAADQELSQAISAQYPRLNLSANLESGGARPSALFETWLASFTAGLVAPVFDGGNLRAQVEQREAARDQALAVYRQQVLESLREVEAALLAELRDQRLLVNVDEQLRLAEAALEQLQFRYRNGATDYLNVLSTLTSVQALQRERLALVYQRLQDRIALNRALAGNSVPSG